MTDKPSSQQKTLVFLLPGFGGGGAERVVLNILQHYDRKRHNIYLVVFDCNGPLSDSVPDHVQLICLDRPRFRQAIFPLLLLLRRLKPDVLFSSVHHCNLALLALRPFLPGNPKVMIRESNTPSMSLPSLAYGWALRLGYKFLYPKANRILCISKLIETEFTRDFDIPDSILEPISNPVDVAAIRSASEPAIRHPGLGKRFVAAGRLTYKKGYDRLLTLLAEMDEDFHFTILGDGPDEPALRALTKRLGIEDQVTFAGFEKNPWRIYAGADAYLLASRWEGMPNAALEALAIGLPVIATPEAGGIVDVALEVEPGAVTLAEVGPEFLSAIAQISANSSLEIRPTCLPKRFDVTQVTREFENLVDSL
jgi:glycosyltransferase involved in cell wall biosynthesis